GSSSASRQTHMTGGAVQAACRAVREQLEARADGRSLDPATIAELVADAPIEATREYRHRRTQPLDARGQGDAHVTLPLPARRAADDLLHAGGRRRPARRHRPRVGARARAPRRHGGAVTRLPDPAGVAGADRARLIAVARGDAEPDTVIAGARVFSAFTREWL